jgi:hypothetical protein
VLGAEGVAIARAPGASFTPPQLATLYDFPSGVDGTGQCIAIIELGGGFRPADISAYFGPQSMLKVIEYFISLYGKIVELTSTVAPLAER